MAAAIAVRRAGSAVFPLTLRALPVALRHQLVLSSSDASARRGTVAKGLSAPQAPPPVSSTLAPPPSTALPPQGDGQVGNAGAGKAEKINRAMMAYLERAEAHNAFMAGEVAEFEMGRRHLAHIMGVDPDDFTQDDIDRAIEYLLPSGLFSKKARPKMKPPLEALPQRKAAQFGLDGRPFHCFFYTGKPNFVQTMHDLACKLESLKELDTSSKTATPVSSPSSSTSTSNLEGKAAVEKLQLSGSQWLDKKAIEAQLQESLSDREYDSLIRLLEFLSGQRMAHTEADTIFRFRRMLQSQSTAAALPSVQVDPESGRTYFEASGSRKRTRATVRLFESGSGKVTINGQQLLEYLPRLEDRKQVMFPLHLTDRLGTVDVEATVESGVPYVAPWIVARRLAKLPPGTPPPTPRGVEHGQAAEAGAIRLALSLALQGVVGPKLCEMMRLAGLLTKDPRLAERQKPGMSGARRRYTWKKR